jgi:hypothetical protein
MKCIYTATREGRVASWNVDSYTLEKNFENGHSGWISQIFMNRKDNKLYTSGGDS